eukprot:NODE_75_length_23955_cov_0.435069.p9 type:complete len:293 gc:universal NODE_75_length_23955_cov_0.435069:353-1231(+)
MHIFVFLTILNAICTLCGKEIIEEQLNCQKSNVIEDEYSFYHPNCMANEMIIQYKATENGVLQESIVEEHFVDDLNAFYHKLHLVKSNEMIICTNIHLVITAIYHRLQFMVDNHYDAIPTNILYLIAASHIMKLNFWNSHVWDIQLELKKLIDLMKSIQFIRVIQEKYYYSKYSLKFKVLQATVKSHFNIDGNLLKSQTRQNDMKLIDNLANGQYNVDDFNYEQSKIMFLQLVQYKFAFSDNKGKSSPEINHLIDSICKKLHWIDCVQALKDATFFIKKGIKFILHINYELE